MACAGSATTAVTGLPAWYPYTGFYCCADGEDVIAQLCRAIDIKRATMSLSAVNWHLIGGNPADGSLADEDWINSPSEQPIEAGYTLLSECRTQLATLINSSYVDGACKLQVWNNKVSLTSAVNAITTPLSKLREDWMGYIDAMRDILDDMTHHYFDGWAEVEVSITIARISSTRTTNHADSDTATLDGSVYKLDISSNTYPGDSGLTSSGIAADWPGDWPTSDVDVGLIALWAGTQYAEGEDNLGDTKDFQYIDDGGGDYKLQSDEEFQLAWQRVEETEATYRVTLGGNLATGETFDVDWTVDHEIAGDDGPWDNLPSSVSFSGATIGTTLDHTSNTKDVDITITMDDSGNSSGTSMYSGTPSGGAPASYPFDQVNAKMTVTLDETTATFCLDDCGKLHVPT